MLTLESSIEAYKVELEKNYQKLTKLGRKFRKDKYYLFRPNKNSSYFFFQFLGFAKLESPSSITILIDDEFRKDKATENKERTLFSDHKYLIIELSKEKFDEIKRYHKEYQELLITQSNELDYKIQNLLYPQPKSYNNENNNK